MYISCGCLIRCLNSKRSSSKEILPKVFPAAYGVCICTYSAREDNFSDNQVVQISSWGTKWRLELIKLTGALKRAAAAITAAAGSGLWVGLWARDGSGNHPGHLILRHIVVIVLLL